MSFSNVGMMNLSDNLLDQNYVFMSPDLRALKEEWIAKRLIDREDEFTKRSPI
jgi:hypothetical protein